VIVLSPARVVVAHAVVSPAQRLLGPLHRQHVCCVLKVVSPVKHCHCKSSMPAAAVLPDIAQSQGNSTEPSTADCNAKVWALADCWQIVVAVLVLLRVQEPLVCRNRGKPSTAHM
jgi:hypothetical protein